MNNSKHWYQSKTIWLNLITLIATLLTSALDSDLIKSNPLLVAKIGGVVAFLNFCLRFSTTDPIKGVKS